jgi:hypothetical protein
VDHKTSIITLVGVGALLSAAPVLAASTAGQFNVNMTLTPKCEIFNGSGATGTIGNLGLTYTSFQSSASTGSTSFSVRCTNTHGYSLSLDSASITDGATGLAYTLNLSSSSTHSATSNASLTGLSGNGGTGQTYYVHGNIASGQDGTATAGTANNQRTLTITY